MENLASLFAQIRADAGDSPTRAAERIGISRQGYSKWETGDTENMKLGNLRRFCEEYKVSPAALLDGRIVPADAPNCVAESPATYVQPVINDEAMAIADFYLSLPKEARGEFWAEIVKVFFQLRGKYPQIDIAQISKIIHLARRIFHGQSGILDVCHIANWPLLGHIQPLLSGDYNDERHSNAARSAALQCF